MLQDRGHHNHIVLERELMHLAMLAYGYQQQVKCRLRNGET